MEIVWTIALGGALAALLGFGLRRLRAAAHGRAAARASYFHALAGLFTDVRMGRTDHGFARLNGRYHGQLFDLQVVPDTLTFRKLPSLWLMVTLPQPQPLRTTTDFMRRPTGAEVFSYFGALPVQIGTPPGFPADTAVRTDKPDDLPDDQLLSPIRAAFFSDRVKEVLVGPRGIRIVWLAEEGDRSRYLIFRDAELGMVPLPDGVLRPLLDHCSAIAAAVTTVAKAEGKAA